MNDKEPNTSASIVNIEAGGRIVSFILDLEKLRWHSPTETRESEFPLVTFKDGKRYELYSDGTFAEVEK